MVHAPKKSEFHSPSKKSFQVPQDDKQALVELSQHVKQLIEVLTAFNRGQANQEQVSHAYRKLMQDTTSKNRLESSLATYILNELKLLKLKVHEKNGDHFTAFGFLEAFWSGKIKDPQILERGFTGLAGPGTMAILKNCRTDLIMRDFK
ncbi:MAG TPA: hypothetical protein VLG44_05880 [Chlamydiales bacterium]|nr:hypothetical protein [Chlamydiales bacterium]